MSDWAAVCVAALSTLQVLMLAYIARDALKTVNTESKSSGSMTSSSGPTAKP